MSNEIKIFISAPSDVARIRINKYKVKENVPVGMGSVVLLYQIETENETDKTIYKLKANKTGVVKKKLHKENAVVPAGEPILELSECMHTTVIKDMCADCGMDLRQNENGNTSEASVPMVHSVPDLKVTEKLAQKLGHDDTRRLLNDRKLVLLVDLDQTIIHTTNDNVPNNIKGIYHFQLYGPHSPWYHTRLRPGTPQFLENMTKFYELHICTFGARNYAHMIAQLLDPEGKYFSHRILSRDECFNATSKTDNLKALFPNGDTMVCIIDDREDVWNLASNLIQVKPYHFFQHTGDINAPPGLSKHELDGEGVDFKDLDENLDKKNSESESTNESKAESVENVENENETAAEAEAEKAATKEANKTEQPTKAEESTAAEESTTVGEPTASENVENCTENAQKVETKPATDLENENKATPAAPATSTTTPTTTTTADKVESEEPAVIEPTSTAPRIKVLSTAADPTQKEIEIEDPDDYLYDLELILKRIHARFYAIYDETKEIADLKIIVPKIRSEVLRGLNLVFSGLVPTAMKLELSRAYFIAKSLGANVSQNIGPETTHLVAVTAGTYKVNAAKKNPKIKIVNSNWLWTCAERWERVDERLFPLDRKTKSKQRQPPAHCHSPEHVVDYSIKSEISASSSAQQQDLEDEPTKFMDTINPLLSFSNDDLDDMNKDFHLCFDSDDSSDDEPVNIENPPVDKNLRKRKLEEEGEERFRQIFADGGGKQEQDTHKKSAKMTRKGGAGDDDDDDDDDENDDEENAADKSSNASISNDDDDDEMPSTKFRRGEDLPSDLEVGSDSENSEKNQDSEDDGDWNMMGAALEREFLGLED